MKTVLLIILLTAYGLVLRAAEAPVLVSSQWLYEHQKDPNLVIVQVNFLRLDYEREHIEGARFLWPGWLAPDSPEGHMNAPDAKKATEVLQSLGISANSHVVLCHVRNEVAVTARMFLMMEYFGLKDRVSFLNGGLEAWKKEGYSVTKEVPVVKKGNFKVKKINDVLVDRHYVLKNIDSEAVSIVDARIPRFYNGDPTGNPRDGHIAHAKNIPYTEMVDQSTNQFKSADQIQAFFSPVSENKNKEIVTYCFIGQTASVVYLAGRVLGYPMKLYDGSIQEWSRLDELPMETEKK